MWEESYVHFSVSMQALGNALDDVDEDRVDLVDLGNVLRVLSAK